MISAENAVVATLAPVGGEVRVRVFERLLADNSPDTLDVLETQFEQVPPDERVLTDRESGDARPEYRTALPDGAEAVRSVLSVSPDQPGPAGEASWRAWDIRELAVLAGDEWLYWSIPHHAHLRELNADAIPEFRTRMDDALGDFTGVGVVPTGPIVEWAADGYSYELHEDELVVTDPTVTMVHTGSSWSPRFTPTPAGTICWSAGAPKPISPGARPGGLVWRLASWFTADPPERLRCRDIATRNKILEALTDLADELDLDVEIETPD